MPPLSLAERARLARLTAGRAGRSGTARLLRSPLLRWKFGAPVVEELHFVPQELRTGDPSFAGEVEAGFMGLAGSLAHLEGASPFDVAPPSPGWLRELHGFGWLRHLKASDDELGRALAVRLVSDWIERRGRHGEQAGASDVLARRVISWLSNTDLILERADDRAFDLIGRTLGAQIVELAATAQDTPPGYPRLMTVTALLMAHLCVVGQEAEIAPATRLLEATLESQVNPDGSHASRNPAVVLEILLDLLPLRYCFLSRELPPPRILDERIDAMITQLRYMRLGDGSLARFNGMGATPGDSLLKVLTYDRNPDAGLNNSADGRYTRLQRGGLVVLVDTGPAPPLELAAAAHAGCLSFEVSSGLAPIFTNCGAPGAAHARLTLQARGTAQHNTLVLGEKSSSKLVRHAALERFVGGPAIRFPDHVTATLASKDGLLTLEASHNGYARRFGVLHYRTIAIDQDGELLRGEDRIEAPSRPVRFSRDLPVAVHFHLHHSVRCRMTSDDAFLELVSGERWRFSAEGAQIHLEPTVFLGEFSGPRDAQKIVLRAATSGSTHITWQLVRERPRRG